MTFPITITNSVDCSSEDIQALKKKITEDYGDDTNIAKVEVRILYESKRLCAHAQIFYKKDTNRKPIVVSYYK